MRCPISIAVRCFPDSPVSRGSAGICAHSASSRPLALKFVGVVDLPTDDQIEQRAELRYTTHRYYPNGSLGVRAACGSRTRPRAKEAILLYNERYILVAINAITACSRRSSVADTATHLVSTSYPRTVRVFTSVASWSITDHGSSCEHTRTEVDLPLKSEPVTSSNQVMLDVMLFIAARHIVPHVGARSLPIV